MYKRTAICRRLFRPERTLLPIYLRMGGIGRVYIPFRTLKRNVRCYSSILRAPPPFMEHASTPLVFISAQTWDVGSHHEMSTVSSALAQKGYTCLDTNISPPKGKFLPDSHKMMQHFEYELKDAIRSAGIAFPPVLIARSAGCLIAQTYISSHPASGLFLISPPPSNSSLSGFQLPTDLMEFNFEPRFPIAIMAALEETESLSLHNRLVKDPTVEKIYVPDIDGESVAFELEKWLEELGI